MHDHILIVAHAEGASICGKCSDVAREHHEIAGVGERGRRPSASWYAPSRPRTPEARSLGIFGKPSVYV